MYMYVGASTKRHLYWSMKQCGGDADKLRKSILNISKHYQVFSTIILVPVHL